MPIHDSIPPHERVFTNEYWEQVPGATEEVLERGPAVSATTLFSASAAKSLQTTLGQIRSTRELAHIVLRPGDPFSPRGRQPGDVVNFVDERLEQITPEERDDITGRGKQSAFNREPSEFDSTFFNLTQSGPRAAEQVALKIVGETDRGPATYSRSVRWGVVMPRPNLLPGRRSEADQNRLFSIGAGLVNRDDQIKSLSRLTVTQSPGWYEWRNAYVYQTLDDDGSVIKERRISDTSINRPAHAPSSRVNVLDVVAGFFIPHPAE